MYDFTDPLIKTKPLNTIMISNCVKKSVESLRLVVHHQCVQIWSFGSILTIFKAPLNERHVTTL